MKHAIIILLHQDFNVLKDLFEFFDEDFKFFIHIDKHLKCNLESIRIAYPNVYIFSKYYVNWGGRNILLAELFLIQQALKSDSFDYIHLMSGTDMPIRSLSEFKAFFKRYEGLSFMEYHRYPIPKWENGSMRRIEFYWINDYINFRNPKNHNIFETIFNFQVKHNIRRRLPKHYEILYGGSNWMSLYKDCAHELIPDSSSKLGFLKRLRFTFASDEVYIHTVLLNSKAQKNIVNDNKRYIDWNGIGGSPSILKEEKFREVVFSQCLLGRKFIHPYSDKLISMIKTHIVNNPNFKERGDNIIIGEHIFNLNEAVNISNFIDLIKAHRIAELNPGPGLLLSYLSTKNVALFGIENSIASFVKFRKDLFFLKKNVNYFDLNDNNLSKIFFDIIIDMTSNIDEIINIVRLINCNYFIFRYENNEIVSVNEINNTIKDTSYRYSMPLSNFLSSGVDDSLYTIICLEKINK